MNKKQITIYNNNSYNSSYSKIINNSSKIIFKYKFIILKKNKYSCTIKWVIKNREMVIILKTNFTKMGAMPDYQEVWKNQDFPIVV